ncbi:MAG: hypothetical protein ACP5UH_01550 [Candidatus Micrarchaeia archaeon]
MAGNIYESRHYTRLVLIPIVLLLVGLYFIPKIQLDSSLRGGIQVQIQTNSTINARQLTSIIDSKIPGAQASVSRSPGGILVTLASNASISSAEDRLLAIYSIYANYSAASVNATMFSSELSSQPGNSTLKAMLAGANAAEARSIGALASNVSAELAVLKPLLGNSRIVYNSSSPTSLLDAAKNAYANATSAYKASTVSILKSIIPFSVYTYNEMTPTLGAFFLGQLENIIIAAFVLVFIAVFFIFRTPIPSLAVIFGAGNDIIVALGAMGAFGIPLGVASIGGLLMLIGYSIDTEMLTSIRILKRSEGTPTERAFNAMKTGVTMTAAAIISFGMLLIISYVAFVPTYFEISGVVLCGLFADLATTWLGNLPIILWYKKRKVQQ